MSNRSESRALGRLQSFDQRNLSAGFDEGSPGVEMALSIVLPGASAFKRKPLTAVALLTLGILAPAAGVAWAYANRNDLIGLALDSTVLVGVVAVGLVAVVARLLAVAEVASAYRRRPGIGGRTLVATAVVVALSAPVLLVAFRANEARMAVADVFAADSGPALFTPDGDNPVDPAAVTNILLLGGDGGPGRFGSRTDTMILVSMHEASGRTSLVSIPRNLTSLRFPPGTPMADDFPNGFTDLANAVFPFVSANDALLDHYGRSGLQPEAVALSEGIGYSLNVEIDDYALVNMQGFLEVIDAIGGVDIEIGQALPMPGSIPGAKYELPATLGPGLVHLDGTLAIAYVRSRAADSDYERMGRQRRLLSALGSQVSVTEAIGGFSRITADLDDSLRSSLSAGKFSSLLDRLGESESIHESIGLSPPLITPGSPDYDVIRGITGSVERAVVSGGSSGYAG
ncbi:MAG: LCP family protein [Ilumatobacteraceae bacterium]